MIADDGQVNQAATEALRAQMRADRGDTQVFDFGPDIETLRTQCERDTGLPAPRQRLWEPLAEAAE